jgi:hypothetical protein
MAIRGGLAAATMTAVAVMFALALPAGAAGEGVSVRQLPTVDLTMSARAHASDITAANAYRPTKIYALTGQPVAGGFRCNKADQEAVISNTSSVTQQIVAYGTTTPVVPPLPAGESDLECTGTAQVQQLGLASNAKAHLTITFSNP